MWIFILAIAIGIWAAWVSYEIAKDRGYIDTGVVKCNQNCDQGRECDCYQRSCDMTVKEFDANWPFPKERP